ncbi:ABC transporter substrate-binding protein [Parafrigoribacterium humi]|uniref:ABC transporter substrate-binding protein n=1 Tax=Parafrigoribacterium humi TaxID=3144664 RepID=UPI0032EA951A
MSPVESVLDLSFDRRRFVTTGAVLVGGVVLGGPLLAGCAPTQGGAKVDSLTLAIPTPITTLDPPLINSTSAAAAVVPLLESFVRLDTDGSVLPALAEKWDVASDGLTWTMKLRDGVKFHDDSPWNAGVAKVNLDRYLSRPDYFPRAQGFGFIEQITSVDPLTLEIRTKYPHSGFIRWMSYYATWMHSGEAIREFGDGVGQHAVGTGPFKMTKFVPSQSLELERFKDYWGPAWQLKKLKAVSMPSDQGRVSSLQSGGSQVILNVPANLVKTIEKQSSLRMDSSPSVRMYFIGINCQLPELQDVRVRQALNYAVDKQAIVDTALQGLATISTSVMPKQIPGFAEQTPYSYDPEHAKKLFGEAGWVQDTDGLLKKDGKTLKLEISATDGMFVGDRSTCEAVQEYLKKVGVDVGLKVVDYNSYFSGLQDTESIKTATLNSFAFGTSIVDASHALGGFEGSWRNIVSAVSRYRNDEFDVHYNKMLATVDNEQERDEAARKAQEVAWADAPWIFLHEINNLTGSSQKLTNVKMGVNEFLDLSQTASQK